MIVGNKKPKIHAKIICIFILSLMVFAGKSYAFDVHENYEVQTERVFKDKYNDALNLQKAYVDDPKLGQAGITRYQLADGQGNVLAYTATRISAIPFCITLQVCWVFSWKTVYMFPAVFILNSDQEGWSPEQNPPMQYTRGGAASKGFTESYNPALMAFGIALFMHKYAWYFSICILFSIIMCLQITKYRDLPEDTQKWIKQVLSVVFMPAGNIPIPVEPYFITALMIWGWIVFGIEFFGIPLVLTAIVVMGAFILCAMRIARQKIASSKE